MKKVFLLLHLWYVSAIFSFDADNLLRSLPPGLPDLGDDVLCGLMGVNDPAVLNVPCIQCSQCFQLFIVPSKSALDTRHFRDKHGGGGEFTFCFFHIRHYRDGEMQCTRQNGTVVVTNQIKSLMRLLVSKPARTQGQNVSLPLLFPVSSFDEALEMRRQLDLAISSRK